MPNEITAAQTRAALEGSIEKWRKIAFEDGPDEGARNCPLCQLFYYKPIISSETCAGCPVYEKTGRRFCAGTPYDQWADLNVFYLPDPPYSKKRALARAELDFLISLREP